MEYVVWTIGGFVVGAVLAWLVATKHAQSEVANKVGEAERRSTASETKAAAAEATTTELRRQYEEVRRKGDDELQQLRAQLSSESEVRVRAETEKEELAQRLEDEKRLLAEAREKLTDTFKALASTTLESSNNAFLSLAKETFDKVLAEARGDLGKREEAITGLVKPLAEIVEDVR